jgi:hypothetical protein
MMTTICPRLSFETIMDGTRACPNVILTRPGNSSNVEDFISKPIDVWHNAAPADDCVTRYSFRLEKEKHGEWEDVHYRLILRTRGTAYSAIYSDVEWDLGLFVGTGPEHRTVNNIHRFMQYALETILMNDGSMAGLPNVEVWE